MVIDQKNKILVSSLKKLISIQAISNIKNLLQKTHSADIAEVLDELDKDEQSVVFNSLESDQIKSEVFSHLNEDLQKVFVNWLPKKSLINIISCMDVDDRTDLLGHLDIEVSTEILSSMEKKEKEAAEDLLQYPKDSAGGLMTTQILKLNESFTVKTAIESLQKIVEDAEATFYVYIVDEDDRLVGVLSLKQILLSKPTDKLKDIMTKETIDVSVTTSSQEVAKLVERYDFLSLPVTDHNNILLGAITVDDVIDVIREEAKEELLAMGQIGHARRGGFKSQIGLYSWIALAFVIGLFCSFWLLYLTEKHIIGVFSDTLLALNNTISDLPSLKAHPSLHGMLSSLSYHLKHNVEQAKMIVFAIPLLLIMGMTLSNQVVTLTVHDLREGKLDSIGFFSYIFNEFKMGVLVSLVASALITITFYLLQMGYLTHIVIVTGSLTVHLLISVILGVFIPWFIRRLQLDPAVGSLSITTSASYILTFLFISCIFWYWIY